MIYERRHEKLLPVPLFLRRMALSAALAGAILLGSLSVGVWGYRALAHLSLVDALLEASMILAGMGPVTTLTNSPAKLFASAYALFSGVVLLTSIGILFAPAIHRLLHKFHIEEK